MNCRESNRLSGELHGVFFPLRIGTSFAADRLTLRFCGCPDTPFYPGASLNGSLTLYRYVVP